MSISPLAPGAFRARATGALLCTAALSLAGAEARATFVGDLVYCDANENGLFDAGDFGLNGLGVRVTCTDTNGDVCADIETQTNTIHPTAQATLGLYNRFCSEVTTWDPTDPGADLTGRYLVEVFTTCSPAPGPWTCTVAVDPSTLPPDCNQLVTPRTGGFPVDGNSDGDLCDAEDGPFPENQVLGNVPRDGGCETFPDPPPGNGSYSAVIDVVLADDCSIHNDFGYTPEEVRLATGTPGFWKRHPDAVAQFLPIDFCGQTVTEVCDAVELMSLRGGGISRFTRHAVAGLLNCAAFGCPDGIADLIAQGSAACEAGDPFEFRDAGRILDTYNNSGEDVDKDIGVREADARRCR